MAKLENWSVNYDPFYAYMAPEIRPRVLVGTVTGHHRKADGTEVVTSPIVSSQGRVVTTRSGTEYELGEPDPEYTKHLAEQGRTLDPENPVKCLNQFAN